MERLKVKLCGIELDNPIIPASGTFGYGIEMNELYDINMLGTFSFKGTTRDERYGNETPRIAETPSGMLNAVGLQNPGVDKVINEELVKLSKFYKKRVMANVSGFSVEEYVDVVEKFDKVDIVGFIELNISCPNVHGGGMAFGTCAEEAEKVVKAVRKMTKKPLIVKLSPNVTSIVDIAKACEYAGADAISLINTILSMRIDLKKRRPLLKNVTGGLSGPAIFPVAVRMVYQVAKAIKIPIVGMGGICTPENVLEMMMAGATCVEIGYANFINPYVCKDIIEKLPETLDKYRINNISDIIGVGIV